MKSNFNTHCISQALEQRPFNDFASQNFFAKRCEMHDHLIPQFISRQEREKKRQEGFFEKGKNGKARLLFLPNDLQLREIVDIIKTLDKDTFLRIPEKSSLRVEKIYKLGETFEKAGLYLAKYLSSLDWGKTLAQKMANDFYNYGRSLQEKQQKTEKIPQKITLSDEDISELDERFLGKDAYRKRQARRGTPPTEEQRKELLKVAFNALSKEGYQTQGEQVWENKEWPRYQLQESLKTQITKAINMPDMELQSAIFSRGKEKLLTELKAPKWRKKMRKLLQEGHTPDQAKEKISLYQRLKIPKLKEELDLLRKSGDIAAISAKELEIAKTIHKSISSYPRRDCSDKPIQIVEDQHINCVAASLLGSALLEELGIKHRIVTISGHSVTFLFTSDGKSYWQDFILWLEDLEENYTEISPDMLVEQKDLAQDSEKSTSFTFKNWNPYDHIPGQLEGIITHNVDYWIQAQLLYNLGRDLYEIWYTEAIESYKRSVNFEGKHSSTLINMANSFQVLGEHKRAIETYKKAINLAPKDATCYNGLGCALYTQDNYQDAIQAFQKAVKLDQKDADFHFDLSLAFLNHGNNQDALESCQKAIKLDSKNAEFHIHLGNIFYELKKHKEALKSYQKAIELNPKNAAPYFGLWRLLFHFKKYKKALEAYNTFLKLWKGEKTYLDEALEDIEKIKAKLKKETGRIS